MESSGVALITGSAQGIGRAIALRLAEDGFHISLNDLPSTGAELDVLASEIASKGRKFHIVTGDVSSESDVQRMIGSTVHALGSLDVMVANAGICMTKNIMSTSTEEWDRIAAINGRGTFLCYKYAAKQMIDQGHGGRIIGASSTAGKTASPSVPVYGASKWAVRGLTQSAAHEFGKYGITVNAYAPGTSTVYALNHINYGAVINPSNPEQYYKDVRERSDVGRNGTPADIANLVSYLASKEASFITGTYFCTIPGSS
ncbi:NAD-binding protein [Desarmillaria tabescens]|uniref:NAD-binding protein n=1 Tax=Armillaria tabescens TaxID=1929756 RepID=A0AA39MXG3_ARMTA|nr:NAD-binding protein [Desarmillaria tabescens]KAK0449659.1 NAD-binding protein [Desarmillaria tabescens]